MILAEISNGPDRRRLSEFCSDAISEQTGPKRPIELLIVLEMRPTEARTGLFHSDTLIH